MDYARGRANGLEQEGHKTDECYDQVARNEVPSYICECPFCIVAPVNHSHRLDFDLLNHVSIQNHQLELIIDGSIALGAAGLACLSLPGSWQRRPLTSSRVQAGGRRACAVIHSQCSCFFARPF